MRRQINNDDRRRWIENDYALGRWYLCQRLPLLVFIRRNREAIDAHIIARLRQDRRETTYNSIPILGA